MKIRPADQARAVAALLQQADFGAGWLGGTTKPAALTAPSCPGFNPKESDLVVSGHAEAKFTYKQAGVEFDQDVQVLASSTAVLTDFKRTIKPQLTQCLAYQLKKARDVTNVTVVRTTFPATGAVSAAYRATVAVRGPKGPGKFISDYVFFGQGRTEYAFNVIAPVGARDQLVRFESAMAVILLKRAGVAPA